jgi:hypothetical protein
MRLRTFVVGGIGAGIFALAACGGGQEEAALTMAAEACTSALADQATLQRDADLVETRSEAADLAAQAASLDERWDGLVGAASNWQQTTRDLMSAAEDLDDLNMISLNRLGDDVSEALRDMQTECRKVRAAGGSVETLEDLSN